MASPTKWLEKIIKGSDVYPIASEYIIDTTATGDARFKTWADIPTGATSYIHTQATAATVWNITHNLGKLMPAVTVTDSSGNICVGEITYTDTNSLKITFSESLAGKACIL